MPPPDSRAGVVALQDLLVLSSRMLGCDSQDEVLRLALTAFPSVSRCRPLGVYLAQKQADQPPRYFAWSGPADPIAQLQALWGSDGRSQMVTVAVGSMRRRCTPVTIWATSSSVQATFLTRQSDFSSAHLHNRLRLPSRQLIDGWMRDLCRPLAALDGRGGQHLAAESLRRSRASELMTDAVIHGGMAEMARAASSLTRMPVAIVDQFGHLQAGAAEGPHQVEWDRRPDAFLPGPQCCGKRGKVDTASTDAHRGCG